MPSKKLTEEGVAKLKPTPGKQVPYFDQHLKGLVLRVSPGGTKTWIALHYINGKARSYKLGRYPVLKVGEARDKCRQFLQDPEAFTKKERQGTFRDVVNRFIDEYAKQNRTWYEQAKYLGLQRDRKAIKTGSTAERERLENDPAAFVAVKGGPVGKWGDWNIDAISNHEINEFLNGIKKRGAGYSANRTLAALRRLFNWCKGEVIIDKSPCDGIAQKHKETARDRVLSDDELKVLWKAIEGAPAWPWRPYFKILILTAQRRGEVANMRWQDIDLDAKLWTLPREQTKADRVHEVPLSDEVVTILREAPRFNGPYVFSTTGGQRPVQGQEKARKDIAEKTGIAPWRIHDLRRTAASGMAGQGVPPHVLASILNHSPASTQGITAIYNRHRYKDEKRRALDVWARHVLALVREQPDNVVRFPA